MVEVSAPHDTLTSSHLVNPNRRFRSQHYHRFDGKKMDVTDETPACDKNPYISIARVSGEGDYWYLVVHGNSKHIIDTCNAVIDRPYNQEIRETIFAAGRLRTSLKTLRDCDIKNGKIADRITWHIYAPMPHDILSISCIANDCSLHFKEL